MRNYKKKICAFTSSRADYGLQRNLFIDINKSRNFNFNLIILGTHFFPQFGNTIKEINNDNYDNTFNIKISQNLFLNNNPYVFGKIYQSTIKLLSKIKPHFILILGDRLEILSVVTAAFILKIPIVHISGGEKTIGSLDDIYRHTITKLSNLHLVSNKIYLDRVLQLGESKKNIFNVGSLATDNISKLKLKSKNYIFNYLNINLKKKLFIINYHPTPETVKTNGRDFKNLLLSLKNFKNISFVFTSPNSDTGYLIIKKLIDKFIKNNPNSLFVASLGEVTYFSLLKYTTLVIGNSSSGITEVPIFRIPTINVGLRQNGRLFSKSIITTSTNNISITKAIKVALKLKKINSSPYFKSKNAINKILSILKYKTNFEKYNHKEFVDLKLK